MTLGAIFTSLPLPMPEMMCRTNTSIISDGSHDVSDPSTVKCLASGFVDGNI